MRTPAGNGWLVRALACVPSLQSPVLEVAPGDPMKHKKRSPSHQKCFCRCGGLLLRYNQPEPVRAFGSVCAYQAYWGNSPGTSRSHPSALRAEIRPAHRFHPSRLGRVSIDSPPWLRALEAVDGVGSGITYRVSWGIETARTPEPPRTVNAETQPSNNLL
jgi:hypothetical protein